MAVVCREIQEWIEEQVEKPIEEWENRQEQRCREEPCKWWMLCLNKLFCWLVWVAVKVVRWVLVTVGKWVVRVVCEVISTILDVIASFISLILSIPILGGLIRTVWNWFVEIVWRIVGVFDFVGSLIGIRVRKKMYFGVVIPSVNGVALATDAQIQPQVDAAIDVFDRLCNIDMVFTGFCTFGNEPPDGALTFGCDAGGFFSDWWTAGSYFEFASLGCKYEDGWRRIVGYGAQLVAFVVRNVTPDTATSSTVGCSMGPTHNYVVIENLRNAPMVLAHEIGHACGLTHRPNETNNLMFPSNIAASPTLTNWQIAVIRNSRHCVII